MEGRNVGTIKGKTLKQDLTVELPKDASPPTIYYTN